MNPEYRAQCLARVKAKHAANAADPQYRELVRLRKLIWQRRESIERLLLRVRKLEKSLLALVSMRDKLATERRTRAGN